MNYKFDTSNIINDLENKIEKYGSIKYSNFEFNKIQNIVGEQYFEEILLDKNIFKFPIDNDFFWLIKINSENLTLDNEVKDLGYRTSKPLPFIPLTTEINYLNKINLLTLLQSNNVINDFLEEESLMLFCKSFEMSKVTFSVLNNQNMKLDLKISELSIKDIVILESINTIYLVTDNIKIVDPTIFYSNIYFQNKYEKDIKIIRISIIDSLIEISLGFYETNDFFNSFCSKKTAKYRLKDYCIKKSDLINEFKTIKRQHAFVTFPQADNLEILYKLTDHITGNEITYDEIAQVFYKMGSNIVDRQINYYIIAAIYIGIITEVGQRTYKLTYLGLSLKRKGFKDKRFSFIKSIISKPVFYETFKLYIEENKMPSRSEIISIMEKEIPEKLSNSTITRRSSTVRSWFDWIFKDLV